MPAHFWKDLNTNDFKQFDPEKTIAILATGSIEQHGPHLPVGVDSMIIQKVLDGVMAAPHENYTVIGLPVMPVGKANEHVNYGGTLSLSADTIIKLWTDIGESVFRSNVGKLIMLNGHGGQVAVAQIVARDLRVRCDKVVVPVNWWTYMKPDVYEEDEYVHGLHGGAIETSLMKYLYPDHVDQAKAQNFVPASLTDKEKYPMLYKTGVKYAWRAEDLHKGGATGDASISTAEHGKEIFDNAVGSIIALLKEVVDYKQT